MKYYIEATDNSHKVYDQDGFLVFARNGYSTCLRIIQELQLGMRIALPWGGVSEKKEVSNATFS